MNKISSTLRSLLECAGREVPQNISKQVIMSFNFLKNIKIKEKRMNFDDKIELTE